MRIFFGVLIGLLLAAAIAVTAGYYAFGGMGDIGERDKSKDITQTMALSGFDRIDVAGVYELDVTIGGDFSVTISGAPSEMEEVEVSVENGALVLDQEQFRTKNRRWRDMGLTAVITMPSLSELEIAGIADANINGVDSEEFRVELAGVGDVNISGSCGYLDAAVSGVGELNARELKCRVADVDVSGIGEAQIYASERVDASVNGIGSITVHGAPAAVSKSTSFLSSISVK